MYNDLYYQNIISRCKFQFKEFLDKGTDEYQNVQDFMDLLKQCNQSLENQKNFIRKYLAKDPSKYQRIFDLMLICINN
ncbi:unnamed protein product [Paramecium sonneborni]|uniref:Uncharacterized protein n=1 Tax=Paramecium sonneborni TaxID=65129 RepID=A0A8S1L0X3_9CILI|nr:unnamed protein product [Paramecium sonneborni]